MKVSQLKAAAEEFIILHGDADVKILWEEGVITEGFNAGSMEDPTDVRIINDWPLPGDSLIVRNEESNIHFVIMYGEVGIESKQINAFKRILQ
jgi:hypothetical protein